MKNHFYFVVRVETNGFFINSCVGNAYHVGYISDATLMRKLPKHLMNKHENEVLSNSMDSSLSCSATHNVMFNKTGIMLSLQQVQYIKGMDLLALETDQSNHDKIIDFLNEKDPKYVSLCHSDVASPEDKDTSPLYCVVDKARDDRLLTEHEIPARKECELLSYTAEHRHTYELTKEQHLFMGVAWLLEDE